MPQINLLIPANTRTGSAAAAGGDDRQGVIACGRDTRYKYVERKPTGN